MSGEAENGNLLVSFHILFLDAALKAINKLNKTSDGFLRRLKQRKNKNRLFKWNVSFKRHMERRFQLCANYSNLYTWIFNDWLVWFNRLGSTSLQHLNCRKQFCSITCDNKNKSIHIWSLRCVHVSAHLDFCMSHGLWLV